MTGGHRAILVEVGPWRVDDGDVILFVSCRWLSVSKCRRRGYSRRLTLDGVRLGELCAVLEEGLWDIIPCFPVAESYVDVGTREVINVELGGQVSEHWS